MTIRDLFGASLLWLGTATLAGFQGPPPVGPVRPADQTVETYRKSLDLLLESGAVDQSWAALGSADQQRLLEQAEQALRELQLMLPPVGPVPPNPVAPTPPPPEPAPPAPPTAPSQPIPGARQRFDDILKQLDDALDKADDVQPGLALPAGQTPGLSQLLQKLQKGGPE
jgi:hypothetical protein